jgi:amino acid permease
MGTGILALPFAFKAGGLLLSSVLVALVGAWNLFSGNCLLACRSELRRRGVTLSSKDNALNVIAHASMGTTGKVLNDVAVIFTTLGVCSCYQITSGQMFASAGLRLVEGGWNQQLLTLLTGALVLPMATRSRLDFLAKTSIIALAALLFSVVSIFSLGGGAASLRAGWDSRETGLLCPSLESLAVCFGIVVFSFGIPANMFQVYRKRTEKNPQPQPAACYR